MTVVLAMWDTDESILVGSDSQATDYDGLKSEVKKIRLVAPDVSVIWASAGNGAIGDLGFSQWLASYNFKKTKSPWPKFAEQAGTVWSRLNGEQRERCKLAGITLDKQSELKYLADGLLAGWLHGKLAIYGLSGDGNLNFIPKERFFAIGTDAYTAKAVFLSMFYIQEIKDRFKVLKVALETASQFAPNCGFPIEIWRVTLDGARQITKGTLKIEFEGQLELGNNAP